MELSRSCRRLDAYSFSRSFFTSSFVFRSFFTAPNVPKDRVDALRRAFDDTMKDPEFLAEAQKTQLSVGPLRGEELQKLVAEVAAIKPDILEKVREAYASK